MRNSIVVVVLGILFGIIIFAGMQMGYIGSEISALGGTIATTLSLVIFFTIYFSINQFVNHAEMSKRYDRLKIDGRKRKSVSNDKARKKYDEIYKRENPLFSKIIIFLRKILRIDGNKVSDLKLRMMSAGFFSDRSVSFYILARATMPIILVIVAAFYCFSNYGPNSSQTYLFMTLAFFLGYFGVEFFIKSRIDDRRKKIQSELPDIIDLLTIYTESGVPFDVALRKVVETFSKRCPNACSELAIFESELRILPDRGIAYQNLVKRAESNIIKSFSAILQQSERIGSPISKSLRTLGKEARREILAIIEKKAAKIPVLIQIPVLLFILPAMMMVILGPTAILLVNTFS